MSDRNLPLAFVDSNVLLSVHDRQAGDKQTAAAELLAALWDRRCGLLSPRVLQEFLVDAIRKLQSPIALAHACNFVRADGACDVRDANVDGILRAIELMELTGSSFSDSRILASAEAVGAELLYSEAMRHGHKVAGLEIRNPFAG